jgi:regulatory protein
MQPDDPAAILERIRSFCAYRERSAREVKLKLTGMKVSSARIPVFLDKLADEGFLDDARFARAFTLGKWRVSGWGKSRIRYELRQNGIPEPVISAALEEIDGENYRNRLQELLVKKSEELRRKTQGRILAGTKTASSSADKKNSRNENFPGEKLELKDKLYNFAIGKGFEPDLVIEVLRETKF